MGLEAGYLTERVAELSVPVRFRRPDTERQSQVPGLTIYDDVACFHPDGSEEKTFASQEIFTMLAHFAPDHPLLVGKLQQDQEATLQQLITQFSSQRSRQILVGLRNTTDTVVVTKTGAGWQVGIEFQNTGPGDMTVPKGVEMLATFKIDGSPLSGRDLIIAASQLTTDLHALQILTHSGDMLSFEQIANILDQGDTSFLFNQEDPFYPEGVFLPYSEEIGIPTPQDIVNIGKIPSRRQGLLEEFTAWYPERYLLHIPHPITALYKTQAEVGMPKGYVGLIDREEFGESPRHSWSILLYDNHSNGHIYRWPIIGEHLDVMESHPPGFILRIYKRSV